MLADKNILHFKHEILYQVARLAFEGNLEEGRDAYLLKLSLSRCSIVSLTFINCHHYQYSTSSTKILYYEFNISMAIMYPLSPCPTICPLHTGSVTDICLNSSLSFTFDICTSIFLIWLTEASASLIA